MRIPKTSAAAQRADASARLQESLAPALPVTVPTARETLPPSNALPFGAQVSACLPGHTLTRHDSRLRAIADQTAAFLVALHKCRPQYLSAAIATDALTEPRLVEATVPQLAGLVSSREFARLSQWNDHFLTWYQRAKRVPAHGDLWHENMLVHNHRLHAVLDWEAARFAPAAVDLCGLFYLNASFGEQVLDAYAQAHAIAPARLREQVRLCRVYRELEGVAAALDADDSTELSGSLDKLHETMKLHFG